MGEDDAYRETIKNVERNERIARQYLDEHAHHYDPIFELPLAVVRIVKQKPIFNPTVSDSCGALARLEEDSPGGYYTPSLALRSRARCRLKPGHPGPHVAKVQPEFFRRWRVWLWSESDEQSSENTVRS